MKYLCDNRFVHTFSDNIDLNTRETKDSIEIKVETEVNFVPNQNNDHSASMCSSRSRRMERNWSINRPAKSTTRVCVFSVRLYRVNCKIYFCRAPMLLKKDSAPSDMKVRKKRIKVEKEEQVVLSEKKVMEHTKEEKSFSKQVFSLIFKTFLAG